MASSAKSTFDVRTDNLARSEEQRSFEEDLIRDKVPGSEGSTSPLIPREALHLGTVSSVPSSPTSAASSAANAMWVY
jgi:hypothetical protein